MKVLLGVCGSIAAYKAPLLVRHLVKEGHQVKVILTEAALDFVTPTALSTVTNGGIYTSLYADKDKGIWHNHVELALWAEVILVAPCTSATLSKLAHGLTDNLLTTVVASARCSIVVAPAMDHDMYHHQANQRNMELISNWGYIVVPPERGELASGLVGEGRLPEPERFSEVLSGLGHSQAQKDQVNFRTDFNYNKEFTRQQDLKGHTILITGGATEEKLDPVRYLSNYSTGTMAAALVEGARARGARTLFVHARMSTPLPHSDDTIEAISADKMHQAVMEFYPDASIIIMAAAVADYKPAQMAEQKLKKTDSAALTTIQLVENVDILKECTKLRGTSPVPIIVGFALETDNEESNAEAKLERKGCDVIVLNSLRETGSGFATSTNKVTFFSKVLPPAPQSLHSKLKVAHLLYDYLLEHIIT